MSEYYINWIFLQIIHLKVFLLRILKCYDSHIIIFRQLLSYHGSHSLHTCRLANTICNKTYLLHTFIMCQFTLTKVQNILDFPKFYALFLKKRYYSISSFHCLMIFSISNRCAIASASFDFSCQSI